MFNCLYQILWVVTPTRARPINWPVTLNSIPQKHNNSPVKGTHSLLIKRQIPTEASNECYCRIISHTRGPVLPLVRQHKEPKNRDFVANNQFQTWWVYKLERAENTDLNTKKRKHIFWLMNDLPVSKQKVSLVYLCRCKHKTLNWNSHWEMWACFLRSRGFSSRRSHFTLNVFWAMFDKGDVYSGCA